MKKITVLLLALLLTISLAGCGDEGNVAEPRDLGKAPVSEQKTEYTNEKLGYTIDLPEEIMKNCDITASDDGMRTLFRLKNGGDMVMALEVLSEEKEEQIGSKLLASREGQYLYVQLPTCGTLNDESSRELWENLCKVAGNITAENVTF